MLYHNLMRTAGAADSLAVEDVFQVSLWTGNGSTQTIANGLDLTDGDALVWIKGRSGATEHALYDTVRGATKDLVTNSTAAQTTQSTGLTAFGTTGFSIGALAKLNTSAATYAAWTFKKAAKFFDVVTFTTTSSTDQRVSHGLGVEPGLIIVKSISSVISWYVYHRTLGVTGALNLDSTGAVQTYDAWWGASPPTDHDFGINGGEAFGSGATYIAYLFAHDDSEDGVVQCGSATGLNKVELGWEPQYVLMKPSNNVGSWCIQDNMRGMPVETNAKSLYAESTQAEPTYGQTMTIDATGFSQGSWGGSYNYIYLAIRKGPMRTPTDATKVYNAIARTGTGAAATVTGVGFAPDVVMVQRRSATATGARIEDRLRGATKELSPGSTGAEGTVGQSITGFDIVDGFKLGTDADWNASSATYINWCFRRAPGFFDIVTYTGTGVARTIPHDLGSAPGMIWVKCRSGGTYWAVTQESLSADGYLYLSSTVAEADENNYWNSTPPDALTFSLSADPYGDVNYAGWTYVAYLFGDTPGLCKAGSFTGNGTNQDIALGFTPRFVLVKRTDAEGDWRAFDSTRGIVAGNDPVLCLNTTAAEVTTTDPIDPISTGFNITQESTNNLNVNGATYIFWASA